MSTNRFDHANPPLIASLEDFTKNDLAIAGGKGANLGELIQAGFDIPPGYVITTVAYDQFLHEHNLRDRLSDLLGTLNFDNPELLQQVSQTIRDLFQRTPIPEQIRDETLRAYRRLSSDAVAVRSSATAEDLPEAAFAGQQETFLNIVGEKELLEAVRACWASLWSERAILYRARQKIDQTTVKLAVIVQTMVPAEVAGVMFTANPVSGARDELIIDANPGLGEAVVSGIVTPDHFTVHKPSRRIKQQQLGKREVVIRTKVGGGTEQILATQETTNSAALTIPAIRQLSRLGIEIERHYGVPQDVEWAWLPNGSKAGKFMILQSRPMTALPEPLKVSGPMRLVVPMLAEMWSTRPYPLDMTTFTGAVERAIGNFLITMIGKSAPNPDEMFLEEDGVIVQFSPPKAHPSPSMLVMPWVAIWRTRQYDPARWEADPLLPELMTKARAIEARDLRSLTWQQNIHTLHEALAMIPRVMELRERYFPQAFVGLAGMWLLLALARRRDRFSALVSGIRTKTTEANQALENLATQVRENAMLKELFHQTESAHLHSRLKTSQAGQAFLQHFDAFLEQYGHREVSLTISQPAWKDQPDNVLAIVNILAATQPQQSNHYNDWQQVRDDLLNNSILGTRFLRQPFLKFLANARAFFQIREDTHFYATLMQPTIRHISLELGRRFAEAGALDDVEDVFHLRLEEIETLPPSEQTVTQIRELVARRKSKRESLANKPMVDPRLLTVKSIGQTGKDVLLNGTSGSPGIARGPARIVHSVSEFGKLKAGDVLVAPVTNPAWTPLFQRAAAVVVDTGGTASHAAIVAREYGIPAVMGTMNGTTLIKDDQWIQVDGSRGLVLKTEDQNENSQEERAEPI